MISQATLAGNQLTVMYLVDSTTLSSAYPLTIEFFISDGNRQGRLLLGTDTYTGGEAQTTATVVLDVTGLGLNVSDQIVATATDTDGNTSEFGLDFTVA